MRRNSEILGWCHMILCPDISYACFAFGFIIRPDLLLCCVCRLKRKLFCVRIINVSRFSCTRSSEIFCIFFIILSSSLFTLDMMKTSCFQVFFFFSFKECLTHISFQLDTIPSSSSSSSSYLYIKRLYVSSHSTQLIMLCVFSVFYFLFIIIIIFVMCVSSQQMRRVELNSQKLKNFIAYNRIQNSVFCCGILLSSLFNINSTSRKKKYNVTFLMSREISTITSR